MSRIESFARQALQYLPGFLYSFNIADFKRRNIHLSYKRGDRDIEELDRLLRALASEIGLVERTHGQRWFLISRQNAEDRVRSLLNEYRRTDRHSTGWSISASKDGKREENKSKSRVVQAEISRVVRCLYVEVGAPEDLAAAIKQIEENDYGLPVNQPVHLLDLPGPPRTPWRCISQYPAENPSCPYCQGSDFDWEDGDDSIYTGYGRCKGCGATVSISQIDEPVR
ncbi:MAG: hypothetical protein ABSD88_06655 [Candidatus Korobacteraceae bacterium]|jgi:hypothetical protein